MKPDWNAIKSAYQRGEGSYRELAERFGVTEGAIESRSLRGKWNFEMAEIDGKVKELVVESLAQQLVQSMKLTAAMAKDFKDKIRQQIKDASGLEIKGWEDAARAALVLRRLDDVERRALGAEDHIPEGEGFTPSGLALQELMLQQLHAIRKLHQEGRLKDVTPDVELMKRARIIDDGT